jgi:hypothetical protein
MSLVEKRKHKRRETGKRKKDRRRNRLEKAKKLKYEWKMEMIERGKKYG